MWFTCCHPPGGVPVSARVLYRLLSLNGVPALVYFTHAIIYLRGVSSVVEGLFPRWWLQPCLLCLTPLLLLDMCEWRHHKLLCLVEFLILIFLTDAKKVVFFGLFHGLMELSGTGIGQFTAFFHTAHPATKSLQFMPNIRQNIIIAMYYILNPGMEYDTFPGLEN